MADPAPAPSTNPWPYVVLIVGLSIAVAIVASFMPESRWEKTGDALAAFGATAPGAIIYGLLGLIAAAVLRAVYLHIPAKYRGSVSIPPSSAVLLLVVLGASMLTSGCGPSTFRTLAVTSHNVHAALEVTGGEHGTMAVALDAELAACPHDDGPERTACVDHAEHVFVAAGAMHDALILPSNALRAGVLQACGIDPSDPHAEVPATCPDPPANVLEQLVELAASVAPDVPAFAAALGALGAPIPGGL